MLAFALLLSCGGAVAQKTVPKIGVSFSPAGLLTPFHIGASEQLKKYKLIDNDTALAGSSGGALAAATSAIGISAADAMFCSIYVAQRCRDEGPRLTLRKALDKVLDDVLPNDAHEILNERNSRCYVAYAEVTPSLRQPLGPQFVYRYRDKQDLIEVLRASCNIPFYFNGNNLGINVRGAYAVDGFFSTSLNRFGCPETGATDREILVSPFSASLIGLTPELTRPAGSNLVYDIISPDLLDRGTGGEWPFSTIDVIRMSFGAPASKLNPGQPISDAELEATYEQLFEAGAAAVRKWYERTNL
mmetsp:Transcript_21618/g.36215  ORF Transcript_21618/g.36215 Transcript_21618/m.36215 type:complete len:302 (+) Transcript_21618:88-993(+)